MRRNERFAIQVARLLFWLAIPCGLTPAANVADFADFSLRDAANNVILPGRLYIPPEAASSQRPLILFLHGGGENGTNNTSQINANIDNLLAAAKERGAFLYAPQTTSNWNSAGFTSSVMTMIIRAESQQNVDRNRLYATGLSNGGGGTWNMLSRYPDTFAAAIPICGIAPAAGFQPSGLINEPIWAFHARNDPVVAVSTTQTVFNSILSAALEPLPTYPRSTSTIDLFVSNPNLAAHRALEAEINAGNNVSLFHLSGASRDMMYYEFSTGGHGIWPIVYSAPPVYDWLFSHSLVPEPGSALLAAFALVTSAPVRFRRRSS
jgi:predicted peptidase